MPPLLSGRRSTGAVLVLSGVPSPVRSALHWGCTGTEWCPPSRVRSALHWGCKRGRLEAVRLLLAAGADSTVTNNSGQQPAELTKNRQILQLMGERALITERRLQRVPTAGTVYRPQRALTMTACFLWDVRCALLRLF